MSDIQQELSKRIAELPSVAKVRIVRVRDVEHEGLRTHAATGVGHDGLHIEITKQDGDELVLWRVEDHVRVHMDMVLSDIRHLLANSQYHPWGWSKHLGHKPPPAPGNFQFMPAHPPLEELAAFSDKYKVE